MKKALFVLVVLAVGFARADNIVTSREYVDAQADTLQSELPAKNTNTVLINTNTAGEVGEKAIYDASADYATQSDALVTASTFNTAVQNALESEFVCIERNDQGCLLYKIRGAFQKSKNLFDVSKISNRTGSIGNGYVTNNGDGSITVRSIPGNSGVPLNEHLRDLAPDMVAGKTYMLKFNNSTGNKLMLLYPGLVYWYSGAKQTVTEQMLDMVPVFYPKTVGESAIISNIQIEEGAVATPYVPYGNVYFPQGN